MNDACCVLLLVVSLTLVAATLCVAEPTLDPDGKTLWYNAKDLTLEGKAWTDVESPFDRLPARAKDRVRPDVWWLSRNSAGLALRFSTDASSVRVRWSVESDNLAMPHMPATGVSGVDLYARADDGRWRFVGNGRPGAVDNEATFWPGANRECLLYLPLYNVTKALSIGVPAGNTLTVLAGPHGQATRPVLFYGTSITQGGCASRPGTAYTAIAGRLLDRPVINLGFSGNGRMEEPLVDLMAELDVAAYVVDCLWNMSPDETRERAEPLIRRLKAARPDTPILMAEDSQALNALPTGKGEILRGVVDKLTAEGMTGVYFLSAKGMMGEDTEGTVDGCHPTDLGMMRQAEVFAAALEPLVQGR